MGLLPWFTRATGTPVTLINPDYLGLKTQTLPDYNLKNARWGAITYLV